MEQNPIHIPNLQSLIDDVHFLTKYHTQAASVLTPMLSPEIASQEYFCNLLHHIQQQLIRNFQQQGIEIDPRQAHIASLRALLNDVAILTEYYTQAASINTSMFPPGTVRERVFCILLHYIQQKLTQNFQQQDYTPSYNPTLLQHFHQPTYSQSSQQTDAQPPQFHQPLHQQASQQPVPHPTQVNRQMHPQPHQQQGAQGSSLPLELQIMIWEMTLEDDGTAIGATEKTEDYPVFLHYYTLP